MPSGCLTQAAAKYDRNKRIADREYADCIKIKREINPIYNSVQLNVVHQYSDVLLRPFYLQHKLFSSRLSYYFL